MKTRVVFFSLGLLAMAGFGAFAQEGTETANSSSGSSAPDYKTWFASINVGHLAFYGDIRNWDYYPVFTYENENKIGFGVTLGKSFSNLLTLRGQFLYGSLAGTKRKNYTIDGVTYTRAFLPGDGVHFSTNIMEGNLNLIFHISNISFNPYRALKERKFGAYVFAGRGLVSFDSEVSTLGADSVVGTSGKTTEAITPLGAGLSYKINRKIDIGLEGSMRFVNTDKLDAWYKPMTESEEKDMYHYVSLNFTYKFGKPGDLESLMWFNGLEAMYKQVMDLNAKVDRLTKDTDEDGVADYFDKESTTPKESKVDGAGVSLDSDGDGVQDYKDEDPFTDKGAKVDASGKAVDSDGDGVPDNKDMEPSTAKGTLVNFQGVTIPKATMVSGGGSGGGGAAYLPSVYFEFNSSAVTRYHYEKLAIIAQAMKSNPDVKVHLTGHTDQVGSEAFNNKLGEKRAESVKNHLVKNYGIAADRISVESKGKTEPLSSSISFVNRRVDVSLK